jgi:hypothetical protein
MSPLAFVTALAFLALACGSQGVNLGSEDACSSDAKLVAAQKHSADLALPACAAIGQNQLVNPGMESPLLSASRDCGADFCQVKATQVWGWRTTSETQVIEIWSDGYWGVPAVEGAQFVELDAQTPDTLYQDIVLTPGELVYWSVLHRGRLGNESIEVLLGPPESPVSQGVFESSDEEWEEHSGLYRVGKNETVTRFSLASRTGTTQGNFVDDGVVAPLEITR